MSRQIHWRNRGQAKGSPLCCGGTMMSGKKRRSSRSCGCIWLSSSICVPLSSVFEFSRYSTMARLCAGLAIHNPWRPNLLEQLSCPSCRWSLMECCRCTTPHQATAILQSAFAVLKHFFLTYLFPWLQYHQGHWTLIPPRMRLRHHTSLATPGSATM